MLTFHTNNLNHRLYSRMIQNQLLHLGVGVYDFISSWDIHFYSLEKTDPSFFDHVKTTSGQSINTSMPSGVTGQQRLDFGCMIQIMILNQEKILTEFNMKFVMLYSDKYGTSEGTWVSGVHNQSNRFIIKFWYWRRFFWNRFQLSIIDIRSLL